METDPVSSYPLLRRQSRRQPEFVHAPGPWHRASGLRGSSRRDRRDAEPLGVISVSALLKAAGAHPLFQAISIIVGTFILEDAATVLAAMQVQDGKIAWWTALIALYIGIVVGDIGLYGSGRLAAMWPWARRLIPEQDRTRGREWIERHVFRVVFVSRFVPGARLPTYTSCGYLHARFATFALAAILATSVWTTALFELSRHVGQMLIDHLGAWRWAGAAVFALVVVLVGRLAIRLRGGAQHNGNHP